MKNSRLLLITLISGNLIAWTSVAQGFIRFYQQEGTVFKLRDCLYPNPVTTPCFWGALGFIAALTWYLLLKEKTKKADYRRWNYFRWFLLGGTVFGFSNVAYEFWAYYLNNRQIVGCAAGTNATPWESPCLYGSTLYLLSFFAIHKIIRLTVSKV